MHFDIILPSIGRDSLHATIQSVISQDYPDWTLYIVGDRWQMPFEDAWPNNIIPMHVEGPGDDSGAFARRAGILCSKNDWICYVDDDDVLHENHLTSLLELGKLNPDADMLRTAGQQFKLGHKHPRSSKKVRKLGPINSTDILTVGMAHTRELYNKTRGWQPVDNHDKLLWNEMLQAGGHPAISDSVTFLFER